MADGYRAKPCTAAHERVIPYLYPIILPRMPCFALVFFVVFFLSIYWHQFRCFFREVFLCVFLLFLIRRLAFMAVSSIFPMLPRLFVQLNVRSMILRLFSISIPTIMTFMRSVILALRWAFLVRRVMMFPIHILVILLLSLSF